MPIPINPDALLTRAQTSQALKESGYPVEPSTLATKASRGGGPRFRKFGARVLYRWGDALQWAHSRLSAPRRNTSEGDAIGQAARGKSEQPTAEPRAIPDAGEAHAADKAKPSVKPSRPRAKEDAPPAHKRKGRPPEIRGRLGANADYNWPEIVRIDAEEYWKFDALHGKAPSWEDRASLISDRIDHAPYGDYLRTSKRVAKIPAKPTP
jgi:hypothetical protein